MSFTLVKPTPDLLGMPDLVLSKIVSNTLDDDSIRLTCKKINGAYDMAMMTKPRERSLHTTLKVNSSTDPNKPRDLQLKWGKKNGTPTLLKDPSFTITKKIMLGTVSFHIQFGMVDTIPPFTSSDTSPQYLAMKSFIEKNCNIKYVGVENAPKGFDYTSLLGMFNEDIGFCYVGFKLRRIPEQVVHKLYSIIVYSWACDERLLGLIAGSNVQIIFVRLSKNIVSSLHPFIQQWAEGKRDIEKWQIEVGRSERVQRMERWRLDKAGEKEFLFLEKVHSYVIVSLSKKSRL